MGSIQDNAKVSASPLTVREISRIIHPRTADLTPSAPTSRSHDDVDPSAKVNVIGDFNEASGWEYETSLFEVCVLQEGERYESRISWKSARWNFIMSPRRNHQSGLMELDFLRVTLGHQLEQLDALRLIALASTPGRNWTPVRR